VQRFHGHVCRFSVDHVDSLFGKPYELGVWMYTLSGVPIPISSFDRGSIHHHSACSDWSLQLAESGTSNFPK
jgi:hypothetical protein